MLKIRIPSKELWDEKQEMFIDTDPVELLLEHSLVSISKWESKHHKPFFTASDKTYSETIDYIRCMLLNEEDINLEWILDNKVISQINEYIDDSQTATWFNKKEKKGKRSSETVTSELVYYWMIALNIPFECQYWHFNRLLTLIEVCNVKNEKPKKMSKKELYSRNSALNNLRRKQMNTHG